jgi:hypothetical protein
VLHLDDSMLWASKTILPFSLVDELALGYLFTITICTCMTMEGVVSDDVWCSEAGTSERYGGMLPGVTRSWGMFE